MSGLLYGDFLRILESVKMFQDRIFVSVLRTDTGAHAEKAKVFGRINLRELGKLARYLRYNWCLASDG